jgi:LruC domain-containing protein
MNLKRNNLFILSTLCILALSVGSCVKSESGIEESKTPNTQTFSTSQEVSASISYSNSHGAVLFYIYDQNPLVSNGGVSDSVKSNVPALDAAYTNDSGVYTGTLHLPAYLENAYILAETPNGTRLMKGSISNGTLTVKDTENSIQTVSMISTKSPTLFAYDANRFSVLGWNNALGTYDDHTGIVNYKNTPGASLVSSTDITTLVDIANGTMNISKTLSDIYRTQEDLLTSADNTEVTLMVIMGNTCWNSPVGYYYYENGHQPATLSDTKIYTIVPNAQVSWDDGYHKSYPQALWIGDYIQLKYYGLDGTKAGTTKFPKDIRIGFVLATNMWNTYYNHAKDYYNKQGKVYYGCSTPATAGTGFSTTRKTHTAMFRDEHYPNDIIIGFEDYSNDQNFDDIVFALTSNPAITNVPTINTPGTLASVSRYGFYAFEDLWPKSGDFDMNDVMADYKYTKYFNNKNKITKEQFSFTLYQNVASYQDGIGLMFDKVPSNATITATKNGAAVTLTQEQSGQVILLTDNVKSNIGSTFVVTLDYGSNSNKSVSNESTINPFIYRSESMIPGITATAGKRWEVHLPMKVPTALVDPVYFGTNQDCSVPKSKVYYVLNSGGYFPFAFYLENATVSDMAPLLNAANESSQISLLYPYFSAWAKDNTVHRDWYKTTK